jgi:hypothetical protein
MGRRTAAWLVYSMLALAGILGVLGCLLLLLNDRFPPPSGETLLAFVSFLVVGVVIASRRPENPIGWMFCVIGLASVWEFFAQEYAFYALFTEPGALPGGVWMAWTQLWTATLMWALMSFALLLFPDGRLPSPRWRPFAWFAAAAFILIGVLVVLEPGRLQASVPNPMGIERSAGIIEMSRNVLVFVVMGNVFATAASVIVRFRRARGAERLQLKWLTYAVGFLVTSAAVGLLNFQVLHDRVVEFVAATLGFVATAAIPTAVGVAILRYRLYDVDFIINRALVYGTLTATLGLVYVGGVISLQAAFRVLTGQESTLAVVASTLAIAALFGPLRRLVQGFVDRRFYRSKYDAAKTLAAFNARLREETDLATLGRDLVGVARSTVQPEHVSLWLRPDTAPQPEHTD